MVKKYGLMGGSIKIVMSSIESETESESMASSKEPVCVEEILDQTQFIADCLPSSLIRSTSYCHPCVVIAGSFALWLSLYKRKGYPPDWSPNDVDIFVTGRGANREVKFEDVCQQFMARAELKGYAVKSVKDRMNAYCVMGEEVRIVDVKLKNF